MSKNKSYIEKKRFIWDTAVWKGFVEKTQLNSKNYRRIWLQKEK